MPMGCVILEGIYEYSPQQLRCEGLEEPDHTLHSMEIPFSPQCGHLGIAFLTASNSYVNETPCLVTIFYIHAITFPSCHVLKARCTRALNSIPMFYINDCSIKSPLRPKRTFHGYARNSIPPTKADRIFVSCNMQWTAISSHSNNKQLSVHDAKYVSNVRISKSSLSASQFVSTMHEMHTQDFGVRT